MITSNNTIQQTLEKSAISYTAPEVYNMGRMGASGMYNDGCKNPFPVLSTLYQVWENGKDDCNSRHGEI